MLPLSPVVFNEIYNMARNLKQLCDTVYKTKQPNRFS